jgi:glycosyltransferase involved in cell wall biosynthesis
MFRSVSSGVVHTDSILKRLNEDGIKNVKHIEYPYFQSVSQVERNYARKKLGIDTKLPILLALGGTRYDKGIDLLLEALNQVKEPFFLLIAGQEQDIKITTMKKLSASYSQNVKMIMKFLTDEEFRLCLSASDFIVLPYRKCFDGASGPLGEGVAYGKTIIGADHGSLGQLIKENCLGYTFESENPNDMAAVISVALTKSYEEKVEYIMYREKLKPKRFQDDYMQLYKEIMKN